MIRGPLPQNIVRCLSPEDQAKELAAQREAERNYSAKAEKTEQNLFRKWLKPLKEEGKLYFLNPRSDKESTIKVGHPDFTIWFKDYPVTVFIEMKVAGGKLASEQDQAIFELEQLGNHVHVYVAWNHLQAQNIVQFYLSVALETKGTNDRPDAGQAAGQTPIKGMVIQRDVQATASERSTASDVARTLRQDRSNGNLP